MEVVIAALSRALPQARLLWHNEEEEGAVCLIATFPEEEHYIGLDLTSPTLTEEKVVNTVMLMLVE